MNKRVSSKERFSVIKKNRADWKNWYEIDAFALGAQSVLRPIQPQLSTCTLKLLFIISDIVYDHPNLSVRSKTKFFDVSRVQEFFLFFFSKKIFRIQADLWISLQVEISEASNMKFSGLFCVRVPFSNSTCIFISHRIVLCRLSTLFIYRRTWC